jgi:hypothetical protein
MIEKNFTVFQFYGSVGDLTKILTNRYIRIFLILGGCGGSFIISSVFDVVKGKPEILRVSRRTAIDKN